MYIWDQSRGELWRNGEFIAKGYAGYGEGKNNPAAQGKRGIGPIPRGKWKMTYVKNSPNTGPFTIVLVPLAGTDTLGRSEFRIHGDSIKNPGKASYGCIILGRAIRDKIWKSNDRIIEVIE